MRSRIIPIRFVRGRLLLLDQRRLPAVERHVACASPSAVAAAIRAMVVRGAPAIGVAAAFGYALGALASRAKTAAALRAELAVHGQTLVSARPTAVNLAWAVERMARKAAAFEGSPRAMAAALVAEAKAIHAEDIAANERMGQLGQALLPRTSTVLTHCNAGALATGGYGTALGVIRAAVASGKKIRVIADETRPFLQGARLTAWELHRDGIDVTLAADVAAGHLMARGAIDAVIVGADRIAANGDVANKIGTYAVACLAARHGIPFYVAAPISTLDPTRATGRDIPIEERDPREVLLFHGRRVAPRGVGAVNPAFDVTPAELVTAIITERAVLRPPYGASIAAVVAVRPAGGGS